MAVSLINDMLRDLDANRGHDTAGFVLGRAQLVAVDPAGFPASRLLLGVTLTVVLSFGSIIAWQYLRPDPGATQIYALAVPPVPPVAAQVSESKAAKLARPAPAPVLAKAAPASKPRSETREDKAPIIQKSMRMPTPAEQAELDYRQASDIIRQGRTAEGETILQQTLAQVPDHLPSRLALAGLWIQEQRLEQAAGLLAEGFALQPQAVEQAWLYGRLLIQQGRDQDARTVLETAVTAAVQHADYQALLGALYQRLGLHQQSAEQYRRALRLKPDQAVWWMGLGMALEQLQQRVEARDVYRNALQYPLGEPLKQYVEGRVAALAI